jgi:hypothetical protein
VFLLDFGLEFVLVVESVQVGAVFKYGLQDGVVNVGWTSRGVQVGVCGRVL